MFRTPLARPTVARSALALLLAVAVPGLATPLDEDPIFASGAETLPCTGLACLQVNCAPGQTTTLSGVVYMPNGTLPLPNVKVYVPNTQPGSLPLGPSCDRCGEPPSGNPITITTSGADGRFTVVNPPVATNVPLVLLSGKWRRQVVVPAVAACTNTTVPGFLTRLPRTRQEGDMPRIAVATGAADALESLWRKSGIADTEFSTGTGTGSVQLYSGQGGTDRFDAASGGQVFGSAQALWASQANLGAYDLVTLSCEGGQYPATKPASALQAMKDYADQAGHVFASHWHNYWIQAGPAPWNTLATWQSLSNLGAIVADVNLALPRAQTLSAWLTATGASAVPGTLAITDARHTVTAVDTSKVRAWIGKAVTANGQPTVQYFSYATPTIGPPAQQCGRVAFADMHANSGDTSTVGLGFPSGGCTTSVAQLNPTEKAVLYALFDVQRCLGNDGD